MCVLLQRSMFSQCSSSLYSLMPKPYAHRLQHVCSRYQPSQGYSSQRRFSVRKLLLHILNPNFNSAVITCSQPQRSHYCVLFSPAFNIIACHWPKQCNKTSPLYTCRVRADTHGRNPMRTAQWSGVMRLRLSMQGSAPAAKRGWMQASFWLKTATWSAVFPVSSCREMFMLGLARRIFRARGFP